MRDLKIEEVQQVNGGKKKEQKKNTMTIVAEVVSIVTGVAGALGGLFGGSGNSASDGMGNEITCPEGTAPHMGDHGDFQGAHCDRVG